MKTLLFIVTMMLCGQFYAQEATIKLSGSIFGSDSDMLFISQMYDDNKIKDFDTIMMDLSLIHI